jgi:recombination protein RecR
VPYPEPFEALVAAFETFPGIGRRSAERLAFHVLREPSGRELSRAIDHAIEKTLRCSRCSNVSESDPCSICADEKRDASLLCVVEEPRHVEAIERSSAYHGRYHVLMGSLNPAEGTEPEHLTLKRLVARVRREKPSEVILGTDPDAEGEATAALVLAALEALGLEDLVITRLARGLPAGSAIEYLHRGVLEDALGGRRPVRTRKPPRDEAKLPRNEIKSSHAELRKPGEETKVARDEAKPARDEAKTAREESRTARDEAKMVREETEKRARGDIDSAR